MLKKSPALCIKENKWFGFKNLGMKLRSWFIEVLEFVDMFARWVKKMWQRDDLEKVKIKYKNC